MFECKYKLDLQDSIKVAKYVYKSQRRRKDKVISYMIPILFVMCVGLLILDIINKKSVIWDVILIVALVILEVVSLCLPLLIVRTQKKSFQQQNLEEMDYILIQIDNNLCVETLHKDNEEKAKVIHNLKTLSSYIEDNTHLVLIFNQVEYVNVRKDYLTGNLEELKRILYKNMSKAKNGK